MYRGRLWTMRQFAGFGTAEETNERFRYLLDHGQTGPLHRLRHALADGPRLRPPRSPRARSGARASRSTPSTTWRRSSRASRWRDVSTSMTINAPAAIMLAFYVVAAERQGTAPEDLAGTIQTDILKEYIAQKEWCFPIDPAMRLVTDMIEYCSRPHAALAPGLDLRLPHPRGRIDGPAGARLHAEGRLHLRRGGDRARHRRRRLRPAPVLLLQRPHRLLRGDREVPRGAPDLGARAARHLRRQGREVAADAHALADRGRLAHRAAALQQRRAHGDRGARGGARRHAVAAHQLATTRRSRSRPRRPSASRCAPSR